VAIRHAIRSASGPATRPPDDAAKRCPCFFSKKTTELRRGLATFRSLGTLHRHSGHLPIGHFSCAMYALTWVKQPHNRQRSPVWCSQAAQVRKCSCNVVAGTVLSPEATNLAIALVAEIAMRNTPGPCVCLDAGEELVGFAHAVATIVPSQAVAGPPPGRCSKASASTAPGSAWRKRSKCWANQAACGSPLFSQTRIDSAARAQAQSF
jgi:hypothetical protein